MAKVNIYDMEGKATGEVSVDTVPDGFEPDPVLIARSLRRQMANSRVPCAHTLTRAEVRGGGRKPYRQKGTGRSRQGSIRSGLCKGGGVIFGPTSSRNFEVGMNRKERKAAIRQLVWSKIKNGDWLLFEDLDLDKPSTKRGRAFLRALGREGRVLVLLAGDERFEMVRRSLRNLPEVKILPPERLNTFDLLNIPTVLAHREAFETVRTTWGV